MRKAVILGQMRSGSTFLFEAIRSHPDVYGTQGKCKELFLPEDNPYFAGSPQGAVTKFDKEAEESGADLSVFKMTYVQLSPEVLEMIKPRIVVHNYRENCLATAYSAWITQHFKGRIKFHATERQPAPKTKVPPDPFLRIAKRFHRAKEHYRTQDYVDFNVTYEDTHDNQIETPCVSPSVAKPLLEFLELDDQPLCGESRRICHVPLKESILNWDEIEAMAKQYDLYDKLSAGYL